MIRLSAASRRCLGREASALRQRLDVPTRVLQSLRHHPAAWLAGSLLTGFAATLVFRRKPAAPKRTRGLRGLALALALSAVRPVVKAWIGERLKQVLAAQLRPRLPSRPLPVEPGLAKSP